MNTPKTSKINSLLSMIPSGIVLTSAWLAQQGYSLELQKQYRKSRWFRTIGTGAMVRWDDDVDYLGAVYALQAHLGMTLHPGAKTALSLQGKSHYLGLAEKSVMLFGSPADKPPLWFVKQEWEKQVNFKLSGFLPAELGLVDIEHRGFSVKVSGPTRAVMECLYLSPGEQPLLEVYELMEGLNNLRPTSVQKLLEECTSVKVKRLFMYLADKAGHDWFNYLKKERIDLGKGKRAIVDNGIYIPKYQIIVPKELESIR
ncbi:type IV toxin-antitoxin system AbiEi family antitoxin [Pantoea phytobeneficialis]|uniref:Type IV toxin-antitoxin system AbiEi family antitoxin n=1 Tax=Pantoea phytobeneficialis TaxID=2052056 RepID=A0AAP9HAA6_9GAMM|nr:type IV toxin-antitoxin system AbiEi family antitoxin [Pantoea phytobeneficialis]MDO6406825.1 type IV toxin-antitoxin system AbiEi family antitoxin [Pantoea phytobeneficialis]QGR09347.1 hypothetical protein CTZ24_23170 [Pantoea phytobeneficialis]